MSGHSNIDYRCTIGERLGLLNRVLIAQTINGVMIPAVKCQHAKGKTLTLGNVR